MFLTLPEIWIVLLNALGIPAAHFGISWAFTRAPGGLFDPARWPFRPFPGESARRYERHTFIRHWKERLPDAAPWFGGFAKKRLRGADPEFLRRFIAESCRSEAAHWAQVLVIAGFITWTPWPWALVILAYAIASNLPCILLQRYNRLRFRRVLARSAGSHHPEPECHSAC